jgi:hypothetical protein
VPLVGLVAASVAGVPWVADLSAWISDGETYLAAHLGLVAGTLALQVAAACALAWGAAAVLHGRGGGHLAAHGLWFQMFRHRCPAGARPWVHVSTEDGTEFWGYVGDYSNEDGEERALTVVGPKLAMRAAGATDRELLPDWYAVAVSDARIRWLRLAYVDDVSGETVPGRVFPD